MHNIKRQFKLTILYLIALETVILQNCKSFILQFSMFLEPNTNVFPSDTISHKTLKLRKSFKK